MHRMTLRHGTIIAAAAALMIAALVVVPAGAWSQASNWQPAGTGIGAWRTIMPGKPQEFSFYYGGSNIPSQVVVGANPGNAVGFNVYTDQQWKAFTAGDSSITPVGRGTPNSYEPGNLFWQAQSATTERFHVQVYPTTNKSAQFWIALTGNGSPGLTAGSPSGSGNVQLKGPGYVKPGNNRVITIPSQPQPVCGYGYVWYYGSCRWQGNRW